MPSGKMFEILKEHMNVMFNVNSHILISIESFSQLSDMCDFWLSVKENTLCDLRYA